MDLRRQLTFPFGITIGMSLNPRMIELPSSAKR
jgi:hypothetical protein